MWKFDLKESGVSNDKKSIEEEESDVPRKDSKSKGEAKCVKVTLCNKEKIDSYK